ncbi:MAG: hypothetical protein SAJ37_18845 [Oscillatoria sp. PMC 1068.18]|nr:hypothetical protein [Oscillatoria sp. PMC 1076.18]MEC4990796.1 hypothetical protein [Oscillatoria sp. PMC 1068.18]
MLSQIHYLIRSQSDGKYLSAKVRDEMANEVNYLLIFKEHFEALSYLNTHAADLANRFSVESLPGTQLKSLLQRWGFRGIALVVDPLVPQVDFLTYE